MFHYFIITITNHPRISINFYRFIRKINPLENA